MYLQKIQKVLSIVEIVLKVVMVLSFVSGGILFVTGIMGISGNGEIITKIGKINIVTPVLKIDPESALTAKGAEMFTQGISLILTGITLLFAVKYLAKERQDGTPFTKKGAESVRNLGIISIATSTSAAIIQAIIFKALKVTAENELSNESGVITGLLLLFFSLILNYGAELAGGNTEKAVIETTGEASEE